MSTIKNVTQLIEKRTCTKAVHGAWKTEDTETTCDDDELNFDNLFTEPKQNDTETDCDGESNFDNLFMEPKHNDSREIKEKNSYAQPLKSHVEHGFYDDLTKNKDNTEIKGKSLKSKNHVDKPDTFFSVTVESQDEIDYFDSDEEYLETNGGRFDEIDVLDEFYEFLRPPGSHGGRYSEGIDQVENLPVYRRSIQAFAKANNFEIHDLNPDGNCMFQALSDQFMINGRLGYTAERLRSASIEYLRKHPYKEDGHHIQSFLCKETWEDYLERMSRAKEWGDHIILQALVDAFNLHITIFNVFKDDVRHTILQPEANMKRKQMQVFLGHVGEFHYLSLRSCNWTELWPYKSLMYRSIVCSHHISKSAKHEMIRGEIAEMKADQLLSKEEFTDMIEFHKDIPCNDNSGTELQHDDRHELYFETYALNEEDLQEIQDTSSVFDPLHIDLLTGIPLPHLSFVFKQLLPQTMIVCDIIPSRGSLTYSNVAAYVQRTMRAYFDVHLQDISKSQKKTKYYSISRRHDHNFSAAIIAKDKIVQHQHHYHEDFQSVFLLADSSKTHAGYCRVRVLSNDANIDQNLVVQRGNEKYLKEINVSDTDSLPSNVITKYKGLRCNSFPPEAQEWINRKKKFSFPSRHLHQTILQIGCTLIKKAHQNSRDPDIEWKYDFSLVDDIIFTTGLSKDQQYGFWVFKILIENVSFHLRKKLKIKHLIAVYFRALEDIPYELWKSNFSGCILCVINSMVSCLKAGYLPHYFIPSNNLIDCYSSQEINALCVNVKCIRMFPLFVLQITAENHGYTFAQKLIKMVLKDCRSFQNNKDLMTLFTDAFIPGTLGVMRVLSRRGFYETVFQQLNHLHEQMILAKLPDTPKFLEVFEIVLKTFRQKSTRVILAMLFEKYFKTGVLCKVIDERSTFAKDILPWKTHSEIKWMEIPAEKVSDFSSLADYFYSCGIREYKKRNKILATASLETAITCLQRCIQNDTICINNIEDEKLKKEVLAQREEILSKFRRQLMSYYIYIWCVSELDWTVEPLIKHIGDIEKLCLELPEMTDILIDIFIYVGMEDKALEYEKKSYKRKNKERGTWLPRPTKR